MSRIISPRFQVMLHCHSCNEVRFSARTAPTALAIMITYKGKYMLYFYCDSERADCGVGLSKVTISRMNVHSSINLRYFCTPLLPSLPAYPATSYAWYINGLVKAGMNQYRRCSVSTWPRRETRFIYQRTKEPRIINIQT
jgi:hypothetical protein